MGLNSGIREHSVRIPREGLSDGFANCLPQSRTITSKDITVDAMIPQGDVLMWCDFETTSLDTEAAHILQAAVEFTSMSSLQSYGKFDCYVQQHETVLQNASAWTKEHVAHALVGSRSPVALKGHIELDRLIDAWCSALNVGSDRLYLAGNSVWFDRRFFSLRLPASYGRLHHRQIDVSSIGLMLRAQFTTPEQQAALALKKNRVHDARGDLLESKAEYRQYLQFLHLLSASK